LDTSPKSVSKALAEKARSKEAVSKNRFIILSFGKELSGVLARQCHQC
jgi:hypothetical protein